MYLQKTTEIEGARHIPSGGGGCHVLYSYCWRRHRLDPRAMLAVLACVVIALPCHRVAAQRSDGPGQRELTQKLRQIIIPKLECRQSDIRDVVQFMVDSSRTHAPNDWPELKRARGIEIELRSSDERTERGGASTPFDEEDSEGPPRTVTFSEQDISLLGLLDLLAELEGLDYRIEAEKVVITDSGAPDQVPTPPAEEPAPQNSGASGGSLFQRAQPSLVIITSGSGSGSGFVLEMEGKKYLVTNEHVARGGRPLRARLLDGTELRHSRVEVADSQDLVRMPIENSSLPALRLSVDQPTVGEKVSVFGNSDGGSVATSIDGKIRGVGPDLIETDAEFIAGNSGSPIVNAAGEVLGIATFATLHKDPGDWFKEGTRFTDIRRFGVRMTNIHWISMEEEEYFSRAELLGDVRTFATDLYYILYKDDYYHALKDELVYNYEREKKRYIRAPHLCKRLTTAVDVINPVLKHYGRAIDLSESLRAPGGRRNVSERANKVIKSGLHARFAESKRVAAIKSINSLYTDQKESLERFDWQTALMRDEAEWWIRALESLTAFCRDVD